MREHNHMAETLEDIASKISQDSIWYAEAEALRVIAIWTRRGCPSDDPSAEPGERVSAPNLDDPMAQAEADRNHVPDEIWVVSGGGIGVVAKMECEQCHQEWPCATRQRLRHLGVPR